MCLVIVIGIDSRTARISIIPFSARIFHETVVLVVVAVLQRYQGPT